MTEVDYQQWVGNISCMAEAVGQLAPLSDDLQVSNPRGTEWYGALFHHLLPQINRDDPVIVVAIAGGTNTGKSTIFNQLCGADVSRTERFATKTKHPVCVLPRGHFSLEEVQRLFPDFEARPWESVEDAARVAEEDLLFVTTDPGGHQSPRLVLIDTPDIDGALRDNWRRADHVRNAADVLVCALTEQKYNDDAVVRFFRRAAGAEKTLIVVFNFVEWPEDEEVCRGWLDSFREMTGVQPHYVYATPRDRQAATDLTLPFHPMTPGADDLRRDLGELKFAEIKMRSCRGSLRSILDPERGLPRFLRDVRSRATEFAEARDVMIQDVCVRDIELPRVPSHIIWKPVWEWLKPRRTTFDIWVHGFYNGLGRVVTTPFRASNKELEDRFRESEWQSYSRAVQAMLDKLRLLRRSGNEIIKDAASQVLQGAELEELFRRLKEAYDSLPLMSDDFRGHVDQTLEDYARHNPKALRMITGSLLAGAVIRPALTIGLACIPGSELAAYSATEAVSQAAQHTVTTVGVDVAAAITANVGAEAAGQWSLTELLRGLFRGYYRLRAERLLDLVHQGTTKPVIERLDLLANVKQSEYLRTAESAARDLHSEIMSAGGTSS